MFPSADQNEQSCVNVYLRGQSKSEGTERRRRRKEKFTVKRRRRRRRRGEEEDEEGEEVWEDEKFRVLYCVS